MGIEPNLCKTCKQISRCDDCEKDIFQVGVTVQIKVIQNPGVLMWGRSLDPVLYDFFFSLNTNFSNCHQNNSIRVCFLYHPNPLFIKPTPS